MWTIKLGLVLLFGVVLIHARVKDFKVESLELSPGSEELLTLDYTITQINGSTIALTAAYELKQDLDNTYTVQVIASLVTRGNSFFEVYRTKPQGVCDMSKTVASKANIVDIPEMCPIPATKGDVEEKMLNFESVMRNGIAGRMKIEFIIAQDTNEKARATMIVAMK